MFLRAFLNTRCISAPVHQFDCGKLADIFLNREYRCGNTQNELNEAQDQERTDFKNKRIRNFDKHDLKSIADDKLDTVPQTGSTNQSEQNSAFTENQIAQQDLVVFKSVSFHESQEFFLIIDDHRHSREYNHNANDQEQDDKDDCQSV